MLNWGWLTGFSPLSSSWEHGSVQAGMVQAELRGLHLHLKAASGRLTSRQLQWSSKSPHPQWHRNSNRATPSSATSWAEYIQSITLQFSVHRNDSGNMRSHWDRGLRKEGEFIFSFHNKLPFKKIGVGGWGHSLIQAKGKGEAGVGWGAGLVEG
jgi:hypothetical protein